MTSMIVRTAPYLFAAVLAGVIGTGVPAHGAGRRPVAVPLPVPPVPDHLPRPNRAPANLSVVDWAGFKGAVSYSFDDGQPSQIEHLSELAATGVPMTAYLNLGDRSTRPDLEARWQEVGRKGSELANHTSHHCHFNEACGGAATFDAAAEIDETSDYIVNALDAPGVWTLAYPFGDLGYAPEAARHVFLARGVWPGSVEPHRGDSFNVPVFPVRAGETATAFNVAIDEALAQRRWLIFLFHSILPTEANWFAGVEVHDVIAAVEHAKSVRDLWMDTVLNVGAYWRGQIVVEAATAAGAGATKSVTWTWTLPPHFPPGHHLRVRVDGGVPSQNGRAIPWDGHGYYEIELDAGALSWRPDRSPAGAFTSR